MKRLGMLCCAVLVTSAIATSAMASRVWNRKIIATPQNTFLCGYNPTMALLYGVQPVISNYDATSKGYAIVRQTATGWSNYSLPTGYIAGGGENPIQSYTAPLNCGKDGRFYSTSANQGLRPISLNGFQGPNWIYGAALKSFVDADSNGTIYMASGSGFAQLDGTTWSQQVRLPWVTTSDMSVSAYGDVALSGYLGNSVLVSWYDFKSGTWLSRSLSASLPSQMKVDVEWDKKGNLGVAYLDMASSSIKFDYLDMQTSLWSSEIVGLGRDSYFQGTALAYDRFDNPVIASGNALFYDPSSVPEPTSLLALIGGITGMAGFAHKRKRA